MAVYKDEEELLKTDWQSKINEAVAANNLVASAQYEQARNDKIANSGYTGAQKQTNNYDKYLQYVDTDYHNDAVKAAQAGDWDSVMDALNKREEKTNATGQNYGRTSLDIYNELMDTYGKKEQTPATTAYESQYSSQIDSLLNSILNREEFSYDYESDPAYQAYAQQYKRLGDRAREDTLGDIAGLTGGYASSWAASAASQAQNDYNSQLSGIIPELRDAAYNRYMDEYNMDVNNLGLLQGVDDTYYSRYRDTVADSQWQTQFDYNASRDKVADQQWQAQFDYTKDRDKVADIQWDKTFDWNKTVDEWNMSNTEAMQKYERLMNKWQTTGVADEEVAKELGVPVGATTESYYFNKISSDISKEKARIEKEALTKEQNEANEAEAEANREKESMISRIAIGAKDAAANGAERAYSGANYILDQMADYQKTFGVSFSYDDYMAIGTQAGIYDYILEDAYYDRADEIAKESSDSGSEKGYAYYAALMGQQEDPEAWLSQNKYVIPKDIIEDLYKLLDY